MNIAAMAPKQKIEAVKRKVFFHMFFGKMFKNIKKKKTEDYAVPPVRLGLNQHVTYGKNGQGEIAEVILNDPAHNYQKVIVNHDGSFEDFPGIVKGNWTHYLTREYDFDRGKVCYCTQFESHDGAYRCLWENQPDGFYWADEDGFGAENDSEIVLYADLDAKGVFKGPFCIYSIKGRRVEEDEKN